MATQRSALALVFFAVAAAAQPAGEEKVRYLRITAKGPAPECTFAIERQETGWNITSVTERGPTKLLVTTRYGDGDRLASAEAVLTSGEQKKTARVEVADGKAKVIRAGHEAQLFDVPAGVIVTSAPDWTDTFLLCRRHERKQGGKQEFAGLWIHPEQPAQRLTFVIERQGKTAIEHGGKKLELDRMTIRLRGNSMYAAWLDAAGRLIKLVSLPFKEGVSTELVREGFEKSAAKLRP